MSLSTFLGLFFVSLPLFQNSFAFAETIESNMWTGEQDESRFTSTVKLYPDGHYEFISPELLTGNESEEGIKFGHSTPALPEKPHYFVSYKNYLYGPNGVIECRGNHKEYCDNTEVFSYGAITYRKQSPQDYHPINFTKDDLNWVLAGFTHRPHKNPKETIKNWQEYAPLKGAINKKYGFHFGNDLNFKGYKISAESDSSSC